MYKDIRNRFGKNQYSCCLNFKYLLFSKAPFKLKYYALFTMGIRFGRESTLIAWILLIRDRKVIFVEQFVLNMKICWYAIKFWALLHANHKHKYLIMLDFRGVTTCLQRLSHKHAIIFVNPLECFTKIKCTIRSLNLSNFCVLTFFRPLKKV